MKVVRWETPASNMKSLSMVSLTDTGDLTILVDGSEHSERERLRFVFRKPFGYRNLAEEYRTALWGGEEGLVRAGWTRKIVESPWLDELRETEPLFLLHGGGRAVHYMLCTEDDVIEVLAKEEPEITSLGQVA